MFPREKVGPKRDGVEDRMWAREKTFAGRRWALGGDGAGDMIWVGEKICP
jgi:hypothetical protein